MHDDYDYINEENYISVTTLMKPLRQIILGMRPNPNSDNPDVLDFVARTLGNAIHNGIELAWKSGYARNLIKLGYPQSVVDKVVINPDDEAYADPDLIPIHIERRGFRKINGYTLGGKFDLVADGILEDNKSTSTYTWVKGTRDDEHRLQGSIYRWIDQARPVKYITEDWMRVNYIFTDWNKAFARNQENYPQSRVQAKMLGLLSLVETEQFITSKLALISKYKDTPEKLIPECSDEELWKSETVYKYYSDASKTDGRATKNFDNLREANEFKASKGKGVVITIEGTPKRCEYCSVFELCSQKDKYYAVTEPK